MTTLFKGLFKWSLEITGASIILFNYQTYERQQQLIGMYHSAKNSFRTAKFLYGIYHDFKDYQQNMNNPTALEILRKNTS